MSGMSKLPILDSERRQQISRRSIVAACLRCAVVVAIALAIRLSNAQQASHDAAVKAPLVSVATVQKWIPAASELVAADGGLLVVKDKSEEVVGSVVSTLPAAQKVIGYRGPSNILLFMDESSTVVGAELLESRDTREHVEVIDDSKAFFRQFHGWKIGDVSNLNDVDAVSGATLTSLAIAEGIAVRLGGQKPSLRFPESLSLQDVTLATGRLDDEQFDSVSNYEATVVDDAGASWQVLRTGPLVDSISGYQGPSELLLSLNSDQKVEHLSLRRTFDNQPYAGYLNDEPYFWKTFQQKTLREIATIDLAAEQVEGVSGATMTSLAVADTIVAAAREYENRKQTAVEEVNRRIVRWSVHDFGTLLVLVGGTVIALTRLRGIRWLRILWNVLLVLYFGLMTGNLISLAIVYGWAAKGIAWRLAPGLASVVVMSLILSPVTRRNIYCSHICPHGAAQQLIRRKGIRSDRLKAVVKRLRWLPGATLVLATVVTILRLEFNLAAWEPFNAYIWYVAGAASISVAIGSLAFSWFVPMGYCRHACGTGRLLDYIRRSGRSDRLTFADAVAVCLAVAAWVNVVV